MASSKQLVRYFSATASWIERFLAVVTLVAVLVFAWRSAQVLVVMDWQAADTFYELVFRVLQVVIGVELARTLVTHDLRAILELLAFVIARKMLKPDLDVLDILWSVLAFVALLAAGHYWPSGTSPADGEETGRSS
ncbi:hypothetical protein HHL11_28595 [Ramlibacter sp. G-1-2-2]|uniref:Phosphate-starvation-inducible E n=1 Tax=Ramlibacter agri TaxID=2728837 RepID=A0A848HCA2_9BURK|nr:hypothetical protein [Ramlibacter agri]NML47742.1 hypothetical protein [Ramlibacter agri]